MRFRVIRFEEEDDRVQIVRGLESNWAEYIIFDIGSLILHRGRIGKLINPMMKICLKDFFLSLFFL